MDIKIEKKTDSVEFSYKYDGTLFSHEIKYGDTLSPTDDSLFRIALISRPRNSASYRISGVQPFQSSVSFFEKTYHCSIDVLFIPDSATNPPKKLEESAHLCFSGGFDSIAAKAILEDDTRLVSIDFAGAFTREAIYFREHNPNIVQWNIRTQRDSNGERFNESVDWRFMLAPALLFRKSSVPMTLATGTILEASPFWYNGQSRTQSNGYSSFGFGPGVALINPISCISEYATTLIAAKELSRDSLMRSLDSLAPLKSTKRHRKEILISIAEEQQPKDNTDMKPHSFGGSFGDDMVSLYLVWKLGLNWVRENYCPNIPISSQYLDMSFFERVHLKNLDLFEAEYRDRIISRLNRYNLSPYDAEDYINIDKSALLRSEFIKEMKQVS